MLPAFSDPAAPWILEIAVLVGRVGTWRSSAACTAGRAQCPRPGQDILNPFPLKLVPKSPRAHQVSLFCWNLMPGRYLPGMGFCALIPA